MSGPGGVRSDGAAGGVEEMRRELERDAAGRAPTDEEEAFAAFAAVAGDRRGESGTGTTRLAFRPDDDLGARGPGSVFDRLADRVGETPGGCERFAALFAECDRDAFEAVVRARTVANGADPAAIATLCEDLAACALERLLVRELRAELRGLSERVDTLADDPTARERFLRDLGEAGADTARETLVRIGMDAADATMAGLDLENAARGADVIRYEPGTIFFPDGTFRVTLVEAPGGADFELEAVSQSVGALLRGTAARIGEMSRALDECDIATSPVNVFRDYGPALDLITRAALGRDGIPDGGMLDAGVRRALHDRDADAALVANLRSLVSVVGNVAAGTLAPVLEAGFAAADTVREGANHDRIEAQQRIGISDDRATRFRDWGAAAADGAVRVILGAIAGRAASGSGRLPAALASETAERTYAFGATALREEEE